MTKDKALTLALDFIERVNKDGWLLADFEPEMYAAITAIKESLKQSEQEPAAYYHPRIGVYWAKPTRISAPTAVETALRYIKEREVLSTDQAKLNEKNK